ncbi:unnamed protein product [Tenebrio molitor]|nr:unnamed protein product [Tenebrio molitor]
MPPTFTKCDKRKIDFDDCLSEAIKNAITQLDKPMEQYHLPSLEPLFVPLILPNVDMAPYSVSKFKNFKIFGHTKIIDLKATMNFENKMLTIAITNPEMRYESDYETKSIMFFKLIDTSGAALVTTRKSMSFFFLILKEHNFRKCDQHVYVYIRRVYEGQSRLSLGD